MPIPLPSPPPTVPVADRRLAVRRHFRRRPRLRYVVRPSFAPLWAAAVDLSSTGLGLVTVKPLQPGTLVAVELPCPAADLAWTQVAQAVRVGRLKSGDWFAGLAFRKPLTDAEIASLLEDDRAPLPLVDAVATWLFRRDEGSAGWLV